MEKVTKFTAQAKQLNNEIVELLTVIKTAYEVDFSARLEEGPHGGDIGDLYYIKEQLKELSDQILKQGEYSEN